MRYDLPKLTFMEGNAQTLEVNQNNPIEIEQT